MMGTLSRVVDADAATINALLLVHARPSGLFAHLAVLVLADLLAPLLDDGRH
jgi:hypothetical protein